MSAIVFSVHRIRNGWAVYADTGGGSEPVLIYAHFRTRKSAQVEADRLNA